MVQILPRMPQISELCEFCCEYQTLRILPPLFVQNGDVLFLLLSYFLVLPFYFYPIFLTFKVLICSYFVYLTVLDTHTLNQNKIRESDNWRVLLSTSCGQNTPSTCNRLGRSTVCWLTCSDSYQRTPRGCHGDPWMEGPSQITCLWMNLLSRSQVGEDSYIASKCKKHH